MTLILGKSVASAQQMSEYLLRNNPSPKFSTSITALEFAQKFLDVCAKENVRGDIAFSQACKETGFFKFNGDVKYTQNNFAGLGATGGVPGCSFPDIDTGILAQAQHLKSYATKDALNCPNVDPRRSTWFMNTKGGTSPEVETLGGTWAVPGYNTTLYKSLDEANKAKDSYGYQIIKHLDAILAITDKEPPKPNEPYKHTNSPLATYTNISPNRTSPRKYRISRITIHCFVGQVTAKNGANIPRFTTYNPTNGASCNYVVGKDGDISLVVEEKDRSWCSSNADNDHRAVTIEVASDTTHPYAITEKAHQALIRLCTDICERNGITQVLWFGDKDTTLSYVPKNNECVFTVHRWFKAKACPGDYMFTRLAQYRDEINANLRKDAVVPITQDTFLVKILDDDLNIRTKPSVLLGKVVGQIRDHGIYTIVETSGSWGRLKSGVGWISILPKYVQRL